MLDISYEALAVTRRHLGSVENRVAYIVSEACFGKVVGRRGTFIEDLLEPIAYGGADDLVHLGLHVRAFAVTRIERVMTDNPFRLPALKRHQAGMRHTRGEAEIHQAPLFLAERQGRATQPHPGHRVGPPPTLHQQPRPRDRPCTLAQALQHCPTPQITRRQAGPRSGACDQRGGRIHLAMRRALSLAGEIAVGEQQFAWRCMPRRPLKPNRT